MNKKREGAKRSVTPDWKGKVLLVVEDEDHNYTYIHEIMKRTHISLVRAITGREAIKFFKEKKIDMVLMDIKLPDMDGYLVTKEIKKLNPGIPVVAQTAYAMVQEREKCLQSGCDDYLSKPYDPDTLINLVRQHIH